MSVFSDKNMANNWQSNLKISVTVFLSQFKMKNGYRTELCISFTENILNLSTGGFRFPTHTEKLFNILSYIIGDAKLINTFLYGTPSPFKKDLTEDECLYLFNLTPLQVFNRLLKRCGFPTYRSSKMWMLTHELHLFGLPRKKVNKLLLPKFLYQYLKPAADDLELYYNSYNSEEFNPREEIEYRYKYNKKLDNFLDMGQGIEDTKYVCKCGFKGFYNEFILGANAGFAGTFIQQCPSCNRKRGDMYDRLFSRDLEDFDVKLEVKDKHFFKI